MTPIAMDPGAFDPDVPGRGAWTRKGGLLPVSPKSTNAFGFYRAPEAGETMIGRGWSRGTDVSDSSHAVWAGARVLQKLLGFTGSAVDGLLGPRTDEAIRVAQRQQGVKVDGIVGPVTMRSMLVPLVGSNAAVSHVPVDVLGGILVFESGLDPAAVGVNGWDHGVAQINLSPSGHGGEVTWAQAMDPWWAISWSAADLKRVHDYWVGETTADPWDIAVANHNSPRAARQWADAGHPVYDPDRSIQIDEYVRRARAAW